mgnify:CR=1 FL=1
MEREFTAAEMTDLTPDERDALVTQQTGDADEATLTEIAGATGTDAGEGNSGESANAAAANADAPAPSAEDVAAAAALAAKPDATQEQKDAAQAVTAAFEAAEAANRIEPMKGLSEFARESTDDAQATRETLLNTKDEAFKKLLNGEIEPADYQKIERETNTQIEALNAAEITDRVTAKISLNERQKAWDGEVAGSFERLEAAGVKVTTEARLIELDRLIKVFGNEAMASGMSDTGMVASKWALKEAERVMVSRYGKAPSAAAPAAAKTDTKGAAARPNLQTLGGLPSADRNSTGDEIMSQIATDTGEDLEMRIAKMAPDAVKALLANAH